MKNLLLIIFLLGQLNYANGQIEISILTCSPGQEVYTAFGHTAIRVFDLKKNIDQVYNFGMFNFDTPNFKFKYVTGKLQYFRAVQKTDYFVKIYTQEERLVTEQVLHLDKLEKNEIIKRLNFLNKPENKFYIYSFLEKNCATETRDLLNFIGVNFQNQMLKISNRDLINSYVVKFPWIKLGINLLLGKSLDEKSTVAQSMFLPDNLQKEIDKATIKGRKILKRKHNLNSIKKTKSFNYSRILQPLPLFSLLALIVFFWFPIQIRLIISLIIGITGLCILAIWIFSDHQEVKNNFNIVWCCPLYLIYIPLILKNKFNKVLSLILSATLLGAVLIWIFKVQIFDIALIPILVILGVLNFKELNKAYENGS